ncbi:MAG: NosD domain-containing protein [Candidatus Bipolaricaulota bacterium]
MRQCVLVLAFAAIGFAAIGQGMGPREPIYIHGDEAFTWANGVVCGSGTADDPYIIEGWVIETPGYDYGIYISNTTAHFVIRNCRIRYPQQGTGIFLSAVKNGRVENTAVYGGRTGIQLRSAEDTVITGSAVGYCDHGIRVETGSDNNLIYGNSIIRCGLPARDEGRRNEWYYSGRGNYWSDYRGEDKAGDGIGDTTYEVVPDRFPLMGPPVELPSDAAPMRTLDPERVVERGSVTLAPDSLVRLVAEDVGVGVDKLYYRLDGGEWKEYEQPFPLEEQARIRLDYYSVDKLGNREPTRSVTLFLDMEPPLTRIVAGEPHHEVNDKLWATSRTEFTLISEDDSGLGGIFYRINEGEWKEYRGQFTIPGPEGPHKVDYYALDAHGNREAVRSTVIWKDDSAPRTEAPTKDDDGGFEPPASTHIGFRISLTDAELAEDDGVVEAWALSYTLDGEETLFQTSSLPVVVYSGEEREATLELQVADRDLPARSGEALLTLEPPWREGPLDVEVPVVLNDEVHAVWEFTVDVDEEGEAR